MADKELEQTVKQYLAQWAHRNCGGQLLPLPQYNELGCTCCVCRWPWRCVLQTAVEAVVSTGEFYSLILKEE